MLIPPVNTPETAQSIGTLIDGAAQKAAPVDTDSLGLSDSAAAKVLKKLTWANLKAAVLSYLTTPRAAQNTPYLLPQLSTPVSLVQVNAGITWAVTADLGGGNIRITSSAAHGLTGVINGKNIYIAGWTGTGVPGFYQVVNALDTTNLSIQCPYSAGLGNPSVVQVGTEVTLAQITVPSSAIGPNGSTTCEILYEQTNSANTKTVYLKFGGVTYATAGIATAYCDFLRGKVHNAGGNSVQVGGVLNTASGLGSSPNPLVTSGIDTTQPVTWAFTAKLAVANEYVTFRAATTIVNPGA